MHTYVVTGGAGFIGTNVVELLCAEGHRVSVVDNLCAGSRERIPADAVFHQNDIRNTDALAGVFAGADVVLHLAALPSVQFSIEDPVETHAVNVDGTLSVLEAARRAGARRVVFATSCAVYGDAIELPARESCALKPQSPYALHKHIGEAYMRLWSELYNIETISLRFFNVYGPHLDPQGPYALVIGRFLAQAAAGEPLTITGDGEQTRDFVHVSDVARALYAAAQPHMPGSGEVYNIGSGEQTSINTLAAHFGDDVVHIAPRIEPRHACADIARARADLSWEPQVQLQEGLNQLKRAWGLDSMVR